VQKLRFVGAAYVKQRRFGSALRYFERLAKLQPGGESFFGLGVVQHRLGNLEAAIDAYQKAYRLEPRMVFVLNDLGRAYHQMGRVEEAVAAYLELLAKRPEIAQTRANLGAAYAEQGKRRESIEAYRAALSIDPGMEEARTALRDLNAE
jgi:tetratricopeptide (TPR) repeat protein